MKKTKNTFFSKNFKDLLIAIPIVELILVIALIPLKKMISTNRFSYGHNITQAYFLYILLFLCISVTLFLPYLDYNNLKKNNLTIDKLWKKLYVVILPVITLGLAILITIFIK